GNLSDICCISSSPSRVALLSLVLGCKVEQCRRLRQRIRRFYPISGNEKDIGRGSRVGAVSDESFERSSLLDQIELELEGMLRSQSLFLIVIVFMLISMVNQAGSDGIKAESKDGEDLYLLGDRRSCWKTWLPKTYCKGGLGTSRCLRRCWEWSRGLVIEEARYEEAVLVEMEPSKKKKRRKREKTDIRKTKKMEEDDGDDRTRDGRKAAVKKRKFDDGAQSSTSHATESKTSEADEGTNRPRVLKHLRHVVGQLTYAESFQFGHKTEQASCSCSDDGVKVAKDEKASALRRCHLHTCSAFSPSIFQYIPQAVLFAQRQEAVRKDVERAFGVSQARFSIVKNLALFWDKIKIGNIMSACIILHNMIVEDERDEYTQFDVSEFQQREGNRSSHVDLTYSTDIPTNIANMMGVRTRIRDRQVHQQLKADLVEHMRSKFGRDQDNN
ncbi:unnamed protein product, partial [Brassica oleracea]